MIGNVFQALGPVLSGAGASLASTGDLSRAPQFASQFQTAQANQQLRDLQMQRANLQLAEAERERQREQVLRETLSRPGMFGAGVPEATRRLAIADPTGFGSKLLLAQATRKPERPQVGLFKTDPVTGQVLNTATGEFVTPEQTPGIVQASEGGTPRRVIPIRDPVKKANVEGKLRGDFFTRSKSFITQRDAADRLTSIAALPSADLKSGAQDIGIVFSFMKVLDPGSVVREGEFATAQNAQGVPARVRNAYNKLLTGKFLNDTQRKEFVQTAQAAMMKARQQHQRRVRRFTGIASRSGVDPANVVTGFDAAPRAMPVPQVAGAPPPAGPAVAPAPPPAAGSATAAPTIAVNPETGERLQLNPVTGQWEPI